MALRDPKDPSAVYHHWDCGPNFNDLYVALDPGSCSYGCLSAQLATRMNRKTRVNHHYKSPAGKHFSPGRLFTRRADFQATEVEVFQVVESARDTFQVVESARDTAIPLPHQSRLEAALEGVHGLRSRVYMDLALHPMDLVLQDIWMDLENLERDLERHLDIWMDLENQRRDLERLLENQERDLERLVLGRPWHTRPLHALELVPELVLPPRCNVAFKPSEHCSLRNRQQILRKDSQWKRSRRSAELHERAAREDDIRHRFRHCRRGEGVRLQRKTGQRARRSFNVRSKCG